MNHRLLTPLVAALLLMSHGHALAGKTAVGGVGGLPVFVPPVVVAPVAPADSADPAEARLASSQQVAQSVTDAARFCRAISERAYLVDCLAERLDQTAASMPSTGDLAEAKAAIQQASRELAELARGNADRSLPRATARTPSVRTSRPLVPVDRANAGAIAAQAAAILERTETQLLRSSARYDYRQISAAVGSTKVLLRSV